MALGFGFRAWGNWIQQPSISTLSGCTIKDPPPIRKRMLASSFQRNRSHVTMQNTNSIPLIEKGVPKIRVPFWYP